MLRYDCKGRRKKKYFGSRKIKGMNIQLTLSRWNRSDVAVDETETHRGEKIVKVERIKKLAASTHI